MGVFGSAGLNQRVWPWFREFISLANVPLCHYNTPLSWPVSRSIQSVPITTQHIWFMQDSEEERITTFCYQEHWIDYAYSLQWREAINLLHLLTPKKNNLHLLKHVCGMPTTAGTNRRTHIGCCVPGWADKKKYVKMSLSHLYPTSNIFVCYLISLTFFFLFSYFLHMPVRSPV